MHCTYCYAGCKRAEVMPESVGQKAIDRAVASIEPGGTLDLGFFGGEPLLEAALIEKLIAYAGRKTAAAGLKLALTMTTNGTITNPRAWSIMTLPAMSLSISYDGLPAVHDRHRRLTGGGPTSAKVLATIRMLQQAGKPFRVIMVVRPDTLEHLPAGIQFLQARGVRRIEPSLDVWTDWSEEDITRLEKVVARCAEIWRMGLPFSSIGWFDEKAAHLAKLPRKPRPRCGFGRGEITVAVSGRLYPCERLVGDDLPDNPMCLPGHALDGDDFLHVEVPADQPEHACNECAMLSMCTTFCRCSNYVRTGRTRRPDLLLCAWNQACLNETARIIQESLLLTQNQRKEVLSCNLSERDEKAHHPKSPGPDPCAPASCSSC
jgi:uncharacterized protein